MMKHRDLKQITVWSRNKTASITSGFIKINNVKKGHSMDKFQVLMILSGTISLEIN